MTLSFSQVQRRFSLADVLAISSGYFRDVLQSLRGKRATIGIERLA
jgi:hypothetical protein